MNYGDIIKRSWHITWRYKALWVLGIFAGVSGCQAGGGGSNAGGSGGGGDLGNFPRDFDMAGFDRFLNVLERFIPLLVAIAMMLVLMGIVFAILSIAARGALVTGANAADEGRRAKLGELWGVGFGRFWALLGLELLLKLPLFVVGVAMLLGILVPLVSAIADDRAPTGAIVAPVCGSLGIGLPVMLVLSFVLGIVHLLGVRYLMLGGQGVFESAGNGWRFLRARFKDTFLLWLINAGLNIVASFALAIPMVVVGIGVAIPLVAAIMQGEWTLLGWSVFLAVLLIWVIGLAYNAVWGTFTSALWTVFFRDVSGMSAAFAPAGPGEPAAALQVPAEPPAPPQPPMAPPAAPQPPMAPPADA